MRSLWGASERRSAWASVFTAIEPAQLPGLLVVEDKMKSLPERQDLIEDLAGRVQGHQKPDASVGRFRGHAPRRYAGLVDLVVGKILERREALEEQSMERDEVRTRIEGLLVFHCEPLEEVPRGIGRSGHGGLPEVEVVAQGIRPLKIFPIRAVTPSSALPLARSSSEGQLWAPQRRSPLEAEKGGVAIWSVRPPRPVGPTTRALIPRYSRAARATPVRLEPPPVSTSPAWRRFVAPAASISAATNLKISATRDSTISAI